ncbi:MAG: lamin tail domain-containing protein [Cyclobacteriaceae bacterium]|nr:lamin tail domain-containing protein [Cyclobacteriaceae bacterium]
MGAKLVKEIFIITIFVGVYTPIYSQWADNFSDNEFLSNPEWVGNVDNFIVEGEMLRLNAPAITSSSYLSTSSDISLEAVWSFTVKLDFNPSSSNYANVYLMANDANLANTLDGYFVKIGGTPDEISLYKISEGMETLLIDGLNGRVDSLTVEVLIEVTRDDMHNWELKSMLLSETDFTTEGNAVDAEVKASGYFGVYCKYTSTRSTKFYFDNISVNGSVYIDSTSPVLLSYSTPNNTQIMLMFDEPLDTIELKNESHFVLNNSISPTKVTPLNSRIIQLEFSSEMKLINTLALIAIPDAIGNKLDSLVQIVFVSPAPYTYRDLVINEIFADPSPQEDLPAFEFVEVYNNSNRVIDLNGWEFTDGSKITTLDSFLLFPDSFLIICPSQALADYQLYGATIGLSNWSALNNGGDALKITDRNGIIIDSLTYSLKWYNNSEKDDGGWSLEQINPLSECLGLFNWAASLNVSGGTPGKENSLFTVNSDTIAPYITQALITNTKVEIWLSEPAANGQYQAQIWPSGYMVNFSLGEPSLYLTSIVEEPFSLTGQYDIDIYLQDCNNNTSTSKAGLIPIANPEKGDIIINELLFNPYFEGSDFVEIYNTTEHYFNLQQFLLINETNSLLITGTPLLLKPTYYLALSEDILFLKNQYLAPDSSLFETDLPTMPNDEGIIILKSANNITLDSVYYSENYHFSLIDNVEGISLERISYAGSSTNKDNWRSAAETTRYASPGYENSQSRKAAAQGNVSISPQIITPNNDGQADFCQISFSLEKQSQAMSIAVYNLQGQLVKIIANNSIIPSLGFFTWDGTNEQGGILPTAHYIILSEIIISDGRVLTFRNKVVVANGF